MRWSVSKQIRLTLALLFLLLNPCNDFLPRLTVYSCEIFACLREISTQEGKLNGVKQFSELFITSPDLLSHQIACVSHLLLWARAKSIDAALDQHIINLTHHTRARRRGQLGSRRQSKARQRTLLRQPKLILFFS